MERIEQLDHGRTRAQGAGVAVVCGLLLGVLVALGCSSEKSDEAASAPVSPDPVAVPAPPVADPAIAALAERANTLLMPLPTSVPNARNEGTQAKIDLGRMLYYETRLSKNHDVSCNSCHPLDAFGVDNQPNSPGHKGARGDRNSPTVYNAALHIAQFWDGRAADVEAQAKGPVLNPIEMASASEAAVEAVLDSIPGYVAAFAAAFPGEAYPLDYDNMALAIGAFERNLMTPGRLDAFMRGQHDALTEQERRGLDTFFNVGCNSCHSGPAVGGQMYRKLGFVFAYKTNDAGREKLTQNPADRHVFKVPSLRNVAKTGPWFHDGSITALEEVVRLMGYHQVGVTLEPAQIADIVAFLGALTGEIDPVYTAKPTLPDSGPSTPAPDPS